MEDIITLDKYWEELNAHDWTFEYSDDHRVWLAGTAAKKKLVNNKNKTEAHAALYNAFHLWALGKDRTLEKPPKPEEDNFINS